MTAKTKSIRAFVLDKTSGNPIAGAVVSANGLLRDESPRTLGLLRSDHAGYVSFDISEFNRTSNNITGIELSVIGDEASRKDVWPVIQDKGADLLPLVVTTSVVPQLSPELSRLLSIQNPDVVDWKISAGSFSQAGAAIIGEDGCETLLPSTASIRTFRFNQVIREPAKQPQSTAPINPANCETSQGEFFESLCYRLGALLEYESKWQPRGHALGELLYSLPLAPCETVRIAIIDWSRQDSAARGESASVDEQLINLQRRDRAIEETIDATLREWQRGSSFMAGLALAGSIGVISGALGIGGGSSSSSGSRHVTADTVQNIADTIAQASSATRRFQSTIVVQASQAESEHLQTRSVTNNNHCHALTLLYYEVVRHFLVSVDIARDAAGAAIKRDVILVRQPPQAFLTATTNGRVDFGSFNKYRQILEQTLLDNSLLPCFDIVTKLQCLDADFAGDRLRTPAAEMEIGLLDFSVTVGENHAGAREYFTLALRTTLGDWLPLVRDVSDPRFTDPGGTTISIDEIGGRRAADPGGGGDFYPFDVTGRRSTFTVIPTERLKRRDITALRITYHRASSDLDIEITNFELKVRNEEHPWTIVNGLPPTGGVFRHEDKKEMAVEPPAVFEDIRSVEDLLSAEDRCCLTRLRAHLNANLYHYYRAIRLLEDPDDRAVRFDKHVVTVGSTTRRLTDFIENRPVAVLGDYTAYPLLIEPEPGANPTFAEQLNVPEKPVEQIISLPTRGVFAEAKLGHCNSCEQIDTTRFWDWAESPCPCESPEILPIGAGSRARDEQLDPQSLPASLLRVAEPLDEPDPTGLKAVLDLLGRPDIFRDMSMSEQVAGLLGKLVESAAAIQKAKIEALAPKDAKGPAAAGASSAAPASGPAPTPATQPSPAAPTSPAPAQQAAPAGSRARNRDRQGRVDLATRERDAGHISPETHEAIVTQALTDPDSGDDTTKPPVAFDSFNIVLDRVGTAFGTDTRPVYFGRIAINFRARYPGIPPWARRIPLYSFEVQGEGELRTIIPADIGADGVLNTTRMLSLPDDLEGVEVVIQGGSFASGRLFTLTVPSLGTSPAFLTGSGEVGLAFTELVRGRFTNVRKIGVYTGFP